MKYNILLDQSMPYRYILTERMPNGANKHIATFHNNGGQNESRTNAQKVCDLLNETSRSQGKYK